jgi:hypothetical protein
MAQGFRSYDQDLKKILRRYDNVEFDTESVAQQVRLTGKLMVPTSEGTFDLNLAIHDMRSPSYRAEVTLDGGEVRTIEPQPTRTYKGTVRGLNGAQARFTIDDTALEGLIITPWDLYFVEPANRYSSSASRKDFIIYKESDILPGALGECGLMAEKVGAEAAKIKSNYPTTSAATSPGTEPLFSPARTVELATEADFDYYTDFGNSEIAANNEIISIMNQVEGIYNTQFGLNFALVFQHVWSAPDPYTTTTVPGTVLSEFANYWDANYGGVARDLAHMWTGKVMDTSTIGIAYRPGLDCPRGSGAYGVSQRLSSSPGKFLVTAHEIGHNFNATHSDGQAGCDNTIMNASLSGSTQQTFCPFSVNEIQTHANSKVACLSQTLTPGCTYSLSPSSQAFSVGGGNGSVTVTTVGSSCVWAADSIVNWITVTSGTSGTNSGTVNYSVASNTNGFPRSGVLRIAEQNFVVTQAGGSGCTATPIGFGQTINGALSVSDCRSSQRDQMYADQYSFSGSAGQQIRVEMSSTATPALDTYLYLIGATGTVVAENDDIVLGTQTDSRIPPAAGTFFTLPATGSYIIEATSYDINATGSYTVTLTNNPAALVLLTQEGTNRAVALDSVTQVREPFSKVGYLNFSSPPVTRVMLFTSSFTVNGGDVFTVQIGGVSVPIESYGAVPGLSQASYITVVLSNSVPTGDLDVNFTLRGVSSNTAKINIVP